MPTIHHIVVVRFSLRVDAWKRRIFFNEKTRESWFAYRAELYRQTLGASINAQTEKPTRVFLLMDSADRALQQKYLPHGTFIPLFTSFEGATRAVASALEQDGLTENIAMTRIDSDDLVERTYFEKLNRLLGDLVAQGKAEALVLTCKGYRSNFNDIQPLYHNKSPFITLFRRKYAGETVYYFDHTTVGDHEHIKDASAEWMQVVHGTNVANGFKIVNAATLDPYLGGTQGLAALPLQKIDADWFLQWAGFALPNPALFEQAPMHSLGARIRKFWRGLRGKI